MEGGWKEEEKGEGRLRWGETEWRVGMRTEESAKVNKEKEGRAERRRKRGNKGEMKRERGERGR